MPCAQRRGQRGAVSLLPPHGQATAALLPPPTRAPLALSSFLSSEDGQVPEVLVTHSDLVEDGKGFKVLPLVVDEELRWGFASTEAKDGGIAA